RSRSLRINYRGRANQPNALQLQDVENLDNYPYISRGNPSLKQEFSHNIMLSYNFFDIMKFRNLFAFITYSATQNKIANAVEYRRGGVQFTQPVNLNGVYNVNANVSMGFPIKNMQGGNINFNTRIGYNQDASLVKEVSMPERVKNYSRTLSVGEEVRLNYNYKEKLDMGISASINYNQVKNTVQQGTNNAYFTHLYTADITYTLPKDFILSTDVDYTFNSGLTSGYNQNYAIWNAGLAKQIFKNKRGEIKASVYDILNQNTSISRTVDLNYIQDVRNTTLKRFFMLTFTYRINRMGGRSMPAMGRGVRIN
ncbi:MAG TPA: outer membrane beta-barrel protein, partial [Flavisolibacter sp.]